jgi:endonuclease/exonuclease/phosphatase family metal-dependent hydrolase
MPRALISSLLALAAACDPATMAVRGARRAGSSRSFLRVVTFNVYNRPWERKGRLRTQLAVLRDLDADVIALQEVATGALLSGEPAGFLAEELDLGAVRAWHEQNLGLFRTGLALLARYPVEEARYHEFAEHPFWDAKGYLSASVRTPLGPLTVVDVHLASTGDARIRQSELAELERGVRALSAQGPVLLLGDFNSEPGDPDLKHFIEAVGADSLYAHLPAAEILPTWNDSLDRDCSSAGGQTLDHVLAVPGARGGLHIRGGRIVVSPLRPRPSDHCPVVAEVELEAAR